MTATLSAAATDLVRGRKFFFAEGTSDDFALLGENYNISSSVPVFTEIGELLPLILGQVER